MKTLTRVLAGITAFASAHTTAQAQQVTLNFDDLTSCSGALSSYQSWITLVNPATCRNGAYAWLSPSSPSNFLLTGGSIQWAFTGGPVTFNGLFASGSGTYFLQLLNGGSTVYSSSFQLGGTNPFGQQITAAYTGAVDGARINYVFGSGGGFLGVDDITFTVPQQDVIDVVNQPNAAPEPATILLVASGLGGIGTLIRRRRQGRAHAV